MTASPLSAAPEGVRLAIKVTPKAARNAIAGVAPEADGGAVLKISVTTVPEDGKATAAVIALLAKTWKLPKTSITLVSGAADRRKTLFIAGDPARLLPDLQARIDTP